MADITWKISNLERETADGYVYNVHYTVDATDGVYRSNAYGSMGLERGDSLIPFADLTEDLVIGWIKDKLGSDKVVEIADALNTQINEQAQPTKATGVPW